MSVSGISSNSALSQNLYTMQQKAQKVQCEFQRLGQDLRAGDLTQAQSDFSTMNRNISTPVKTDSPLSQAFGTLGTALQSGNLATARKAYSALQQAGQQPNVSDPRHTMGGSPASGISSSQNPLVGHFGNVTSGSTGGSASAAQTSYSILACKFPLAGLGSASSVASLAGALSFLA